MTLTAPSVTAPAWGVVVIDGPDDGDREASRLEAELSGRIAVGTQVLVIDVGAVNNLDGAALGVLAGAAKRLQDERMGSVVLRGASVSLLRQLRMMRLDHVFELEI